METFHTGSVHLFFSSPRSGWVLRSLGVSAGVSLPLDLELGNYIPSAIATHIPAYRRRHIGHNVQGVYLLCVRSPLMQPPLP